MPSIVRLVVVSCHLISKMELVSVLNVVLMHFLFILQEKDCRVPFCTNIKNKLKQQQAAARIQQDALTRRRMAAMACGISGSSASHPSHCGPNSLASMGGHAKSLGIGAAPVGMTSPGQMMPNHTAPGVGMKPLGGPSPAPNTQLQQTIRQVTDWVVSLYSLCKYVIMRVFVLDLRCKKRQKYKLRPGT